MKTKRLFKTAVLLATVGVVGVVWWQRVPLHDWWRLRGYTPSAAVAQLATDDTMLPYTRHLFYLNQPQLPTTVTAFRKSCPENQDTIVLGCYHPDQNGIYIYDVQDQSLAGIQQVTAAHEVLHSVYARLSSKDRQQLNAELQSYYQNGLTDETVKAEVAIYQKTEPTSVYDEMSCTFGTEIAQLPAALEAYYARFFSDRQKIVGYEQQYQAKFSALQQQISDYDTHLSDLKSQIDGQEADLKTQSSQIDSRKSQLQQLLNSGQVSAYNSAVASYNAQVDGYNAELTTLKQNIASYNQLVDERNGVAGQLTTLDNAIDTRLSTASSTP